MPLIMYIHNGQNHKKGYNIKVNGKVEAGCEEPVGNIRRNLVKQMVLSVEIGADRGWGSRYAHSI